MKPYSLLLLAGALALLVGAFTSSWLTASMHESTMSLGLLRSSFCEGDGGCHSEVILKYLVKGNMHGRELIGMMMGMLALLGGVTAAVLAAIAGFTTMGGRRGPATIAWIITAAAAFLALVFVVLMSMNSPAGPGWSAIVFLLGAASTIAGALMATRAIPAASRQMMMPMNMMPPMGMQPGYMAPPPGMAPQTPPCNQCGGPTQFVAQYGKLFCGRCNRFLV